MYNEGGTEAWLEKALAQGESDAMAELGSCLFYGREIRRDMERSERLYREAAMLGNSEAQYLVAQRFCYDQTLEFMEWLGRAALQGHTSAADNMACRASGHLKRYDLGAPGRIVFQIGSVLSGNELWKKWKARADIEAGERCVKLFEQWCGQAKRAISCWLWMSRQERVVKDIRLQVADLIWEGRAAWSERF